MKIATFNINNVNRRLPNLLAWLKVAKPDTGTYRRRCRPCCARQA
jgi:exonuclease III